MLWNVKHVSLLFLEISRPFYITHLPNTGLLFKQGMGLWCTWSSKLEVDQ